MSSGVSSSGSGASFLTFIRTSESAVASPKRTISEPLAYVFFGLAGVTGVVMTGMLGTEIDGLEVVGVELGADVLSAFLAAFFAFFFLAGCLIASGVNGSLRAPSTRRRRERCSGVAWSTTGSASVSETLAVAPGVAG